MIPLLEEINARGDDSNRRRTENQHQVDCALAYEAASRSATTVRNRLPYLQKKTDHTHMCVVGFFALFNFCLLKKISLCFQKFTDKVILI